MLDHPGVLGGRALDEAVAGGRGEAGDPAAVRLAVGDVAAGGVRGDVEVVLPPLRALGEGLRGVLLPRCGRELGEREVRAGHLQGLRGAAPGVGDGRHVVQLQVLVQGGALPDRQHGLARRGQVPLGRHGGRPDQGLERPAQVEVRAAEGANAGEGRRGRVAVHDVGAARAVQPAVPDAAVLPGELVQRLGDVGPGPRVEEGEQLHLVAVDVPAGEGAVLRPVAAADGVHLAVAAAVAAVGVADDVRVQEGVVERGVEGGALVVGAAAHADGVQPVAPGPAGRVPHGVEGAVRRVLGGEVRLGARPADVGDADLDADGAVAGRELDVAARPLAGDGPSAVGEAAGAAGGRGRARVQPVVLPGAGRLERAVEAGGEVQRVVGALAFGVEIAAEVPGGHRTGDGTGLRVDGDRGVGGAHLGVGGADEQGGRFVGGVCEPGRAGAGRGRQVGGDTRREADLVVAGLGRLVGVAEVGGVDGVLGVGGGRGGDLTGVGEERDVAAAARAARAGHVGQAEASDAGGVVLVAARRGGAGGIASGVLRAEGEHAERGDGAREDVPAVLGADERIDVRGGVLEQFGGCRGGRQGGRGTGDRQNGGQQQGRRAQTHDAAPPPSDGSRTTGRTSRRDSSVRHAYHGRGRPRAGAHRKGIRTGQSGRPTRLTALSVDAVKSCADQ